MEKGDNISSIFIIDEKQYLIINQEKIDVKLETKFQLKELNGVIKQYETIGYTNIRHLFDNGVHPIGMSD